MERFSIAARMKRGIRSFFRGIGGDPRKKQSCAAKAEVEEEAEEESSHGCSLTLEEMIHQLDLEEAAATRSRSIFPAIHRRSCVDSSDMLGSARNAALSQYPRLSLDGRDSMYRSSFGRSLAVKFQDTIAATSTNGSGIGKQKAEAVGGERVEWRKAGVVPRLMGLEAMPMPVQKRRDTCRRRAAQEASRKQGLRRLATRELHRERVAMAGMMSPFTTAGYRDWTAAQFACAGSDWRYDLRRHFPAE